MKALAVVLVLVCLSQAQALIQVKKVVGKTTYIPATKTIVADTSGPAGEGDCSSGIGVCNNCQSSDDKCSTRRVQPATVLSVLLALESGNSGRLVAVDPAGMVMPAVVTQSFSVKGKRYGRLSVNWTDLCEALNAKGECSCMEHILGANRPSCSDSAQLDSMVRVGLDINGDGRLRMFDDDFLDLNVVIQKANSLR